VDELVADHELAELELTSERTRGAGADQALHPELFHRPDVGAVGDLRGRQLVLTPVARKEGDALAADLPDHEGRRRLAVGRIELDLVDVLEERVEPRA